MTRPSSRFIFTHVPQQHRAGCCVAVLAMIKGISYERVLAQTLASGSGTSRARLIESIFMLDGSIQARKQIGRPFADAHIITVRCVGQSKRWWHALAMDANGMVLDPDPPRHLPARYRNLTSYLTRSGAEFKEVIGVWWHR